MAMINSQQKYMSLGKVQKYINNGSENYSSADEKFYPGRINSNSSSYRWLGIIPVIVVMLFMTLAVFYFIIIPNMTARQFQQIFLSGDCKDTTAFIYDGQHNLKHWPNPPVHTEVAKVARYVMHISEWGSLATISTHENLTGYPFNNIFSVSDGPFDNSTGVPYFYFTPLELSVKDLEVSSKASLTVSLAQSDYCAMKRMDPEDPRCAHIILSGQIVKLQEGSDEEAFAKSSLFSRHWEMPSWPTGHSWFFAKLDIQHIYILDYFGGAIVIDVAEYFNTSF